MLFEDGTDVDLVAVGATGARDVRVWVRSRRPGRHLLEVEGRQVPFEVPGRGDGTASVRCEGLAPRTRSRYRVTGPGGELVGEGSFETAPASAADAPDRFSIAVVSCHQPFDDSGRVRPAAAHMLEVLERTVAERGVKRVLEIGDQMYADLPEGLSLHDGQYFERVAPPGRRTLLDCTAEEVRRLYAARWRSFLSVPALARVHASVPCYPMHDDHEIVDNFGSLPEHTLAPWASLREGALQASFDHQALRLMPHPRPSSVHFQLSYGPLAAFVMDLRSQRRATGDAVMIYDPRQLAELEHFLEGTGDAAVVLVGLSVPLVHVPDWLASLGSSVGMGDAADRWSFRAAARSRERLLATLHRHRLRHPRQLLLLVSGDVHVGTVAELRFPDTALLQLTSSALTNEEGDWIQEAAALAPRMIAHLDGGAGAPDANVRILEGREGDRNPYNGLNLGIVELARSGEGWTVRLDLVGARGVVFSTGDLGPYGERPAGHELRLS